jgi:hypothetical protein
VTDSTRWYQAAAAGRLRPAPGANRPDSTQFPVVGAGTRWKRALATISTCVPLSGAFYVFYDTLMQYVLTQFPVVDRSPAQRTINPEI